MYRHQVYRFILNATRIHIASAAADAILYLLSLRRMYFWRACVCVCGINYVWKHSYPVASAVAVVLGRANDRITVSECVSVSEHIRILLDMYRNFIRRIVGSSMCACVCRITGMCACVRVCCGASGINIVCLLHIFVVAIFVFYFFVFLICFRSRFSLIRSLSLAVCACVSLCDVELLCCGFFILLCFNTNTIAWGRYISPFVMLIMKTTH